MSSYLLHILFSSLLPCLGSSPATQPFFDLFSQTNIYKKKVMHLDLELEGVEIVIKVVHADVTILSSTGK